jgi:hypothetical protein
MKVVKHYGRNWPSRILLDQDLRGVSVDRNIRLSLGASYSIVISKEEWASIKRALKGPRFCGRCGWPAFTKPKKRRR